MMMFSLVYSRREDITFFVTEFVCCAQLSVPYVFLSRQLSLVP